MTAMSDNAWACGNSASMTHIYDSYANAANTHSNNANAAAASSSYVSNTAKAERKNEPRHKFIGTCSYIKLHEKVGQPGDVYYTTDTQELYGWIDGMWTLMCNHTSIQSVVERTEIPSLLGENMYITKAKTIVAHNQAGEVMYSFNV